MLVTKDAVVALSVQKLEEVLSLARYQNTANLLQIDFHDVWDAMRREKTKREQSDVFHGFVRPYYELWISAVYVVHEGFIALDIQDDKLNRLRGKADLSIMRRFRNATFHFQPHWRSPKHGALVMGTVPREAGMTGWVHKLHDRHGILARKLTSWVKHNPHAERTRL